jgi:Rad3-related DNA helicase
VLQAAGRVIRSETDRGVVLLVDERYAQRGYRTLLPVNWQVQTLADLSRFKTLLNDFWDHSA